MDGNIFKKEICNLFRLFPVFFSALVEIRNQLLMGVSQSDFVKQVLRIYRNYPLFANRSVLLQVVCYTFPLNQKLEKLHPVNDLGEKP